MESTKFDVGLDMYCNGRKEIKDCFKVFALRRWKHAVPSLNGEEQVRRLES